MCIFALCGVTDIGVSQFSTIAFVRYAALSGMSVPFLLSFFMPNWKTFQWASLALVSIPVASILIASVCVGILLTVEAME